MAKRQTLTPQQVYHEFSGADIGVIKQNIVCLFGAFGLPIARIAEIVNYQPKAVETLLKSKPGQETIERYRDGFVKDLDLKKLHLADKLLTSASKAVEYLDTVLDMPKKDASVAQKIKASEATLANLMKMGAFSSKEKFATPVININIGNIPAVQKGIAEMKSPVVEVTAEEVKK